MDKYQLHQQLGKIMPVKKKPTIKTKPRKVKIDPYLALLSLFQKEVQKKALSRVPASGEVKYSPEIANLIMIENFINDRLKK